MATSAERMRAYRERARRGLRRLAVAVGLFLTDSLSRMGIARLIERSGGVATCRSPSMFTCCGTRRGMRRPAEDWTRGAYSTIGSRGTALTPNLTTGIFE